MVKLSREYEEEPENRRVVDVQDQTLTDTSLPKTALEQLADQVLEYAMTNERIKLLAAQLKKKKFLLELLVTKIGSLTSKGHYEFSYGGVTGTVQNKQKMKFNDFEAERILREKGLYDKVTTIAFDQAKILEAYNLGLLDAQDIDAMFVSTPYTAFNCDVLGNPEYAALKELRKQAEREAEKAEQGGIESTDG